MSCEYTKWNLKTSKKKMIGSVSKRYLSKCQTRGMHILTKFQPNKQKSAPWQTTSERNEQVSEDMFYNKNHQNPTVLATIKRNKSLTQIHTHTQNEQARTFLSFHCQTCKFCHKLHFFRVCFDKSFFCSIAFLSFVVQNGRASNKTAMIPVLQKRKKINMTVFFVNEFLNCYSVVKNRTVLHFFPLLICADSSGQIDWKNNRYISIELWPSAFYALFCGWKSFSL